VDVTANHDLTAFIQPLFAVRNQIVHEGGGQPTQIQGRHSGGSG
jgi:hypothetical protein